MKSSLPRHYSLIDNIINQIDSGLKTLSGQNEQATRAKPSTKNKTNQTLR